MDTILSILGILGLGALVIAAYVFASAAKRYVSGESLQAEMEAMDSDLSPYRHWAERSRSDRRKNDEPVEFPLTVNGKVIEFDRRKADRRRAA